MQENKRAALRNFAYRFWFVFLFSTSLFPMKPIFQPAIATGVRRYNGPLGGYCATAWRR
jgi:hypothetical protein